MYSGKESYGEIPSTIFFQLPACFFKWHKTQLSADVATSCSGDVGSVRVYGECVKLTTVLSTSLETSAVCCLPSVFERYPHSLYSTQQFQLQEKGRARNLVTPLWINQKSEFSFWRALCIFNVLCEVWAQTHDNSFHSAFDHAISVAIWNIWYSS